jgi:hypothetical protein
MANSKSKQQPRNDMLKSPVGLVVFALVFGVLGYAVRALTHASPVASPAASSIKLDQNDPYLGSEVTFATTYPKPTNPINKNQPMVQIDCFQDVNGDGKVDTTNNYTYGNGSLSPDLVYGGLITTNQEYQKSLTGYAGDVLGGGGSIWKDRGGAATCNATLFYYQRGKGQNNEQFIYLAKTADWQAGAAR